MGQNQIPIAATAAFATLLTAGIARSQEISAEDVFVPQTNFLSDSASPMLTPLSEIVTDDLRAAVGRGYDPIRGVILPRICVEAKGKVSVLEPGTDTRLSFRSVTNSAQDRAASESSFSFGALLKEVSLGFGHSEGASSYFNSVDGFGRIRAVIATKGSTLNTIDWNKDALTLLNDKAGPRRFIEECGTYFIRAAYSGHRLDERVKFTLTVEQSTRKAANKLSGGVGKVFSVAAGSGDAASHVNCYSTVSFIHKGRGAYSIPPIGKQKRQDEEQAGSGEQSGMAAPLDEPATGDAPKAPQPSDPNLPGDPDAKCATIDGKSVLQATIDYYNGGFREAVSHAAVGSELPLYIVVEQYTAPEYGLPQRSKLPTWNDGLVRTVSRSTELYLKLVDAISNLDYALEPGKIKRIDEFFSVKAEEDKSVNPVVPIPPPEVVLRKREAAMQMFEDYAAAIERCATLAGGPESVSGISATLLCNEALKAAIDAGKVEAVTLERNFSE